MTERANNTIHVIANCRDCDWNCEDIATARDKARKHAKQHGHYVSVEIGYAVAYDCRAKNPKKSKKDQP